MLLLQIRFYKKVYIQSTRTFNVYLKVIFIVAYG